MVFAEFGYTTNIKAPTIPDPIPTPTHPDFSGALICMYKSWLLVFGMTTSTQIPIFVQYAFAKVTVTNWLYLALNQEVNQ